MAKLKDEDDEVFSKIVSSLQENDGDRAKALANELSLMMKMGGLLTEAKLVLEQLNLRLSTVTDLRDLADATTPSLKAINNIMPDLAAIAPDSKLAVENISELIEGAIVGSKQGN